MTDYINRSLHVSLQKLRKKKVDFCGMLYMLLIHTAMLSSQGISHAKFTFDDFLTKITVLLQKKFASFTRVETDSS